MDQTSSYIHIKPIIRQLISDVIDIILSRWKFEWSLETPKMGVHFYYQNLKELNSFQSAISELSKISKVQSKYEKYGIEKLVLAFMDAVLALLPNREMLDQVIDNCWPYFCKYLDSDYVPVRLLIGLSNIQANQSEFILDNDTKIIFFGRESLYSELYKFATIWQGSVFPDDPSLLVSCKGVIQVDFSLPATPGNVGYGNYSNVCIDKLHVLSNAIRLAGFGRIITEPWIPILNPEFPIDGIRVIGKNSASLDTAYYLLDNEMLERFQNLYTILRRIEDEDECHQDEGSAVRRRFISAISRFANTYEQGLWESVIVDVIIVMESLLTPNKQGGRMQLALAASNLLGMTEIEAREIFENINRMYAIRNGYVHGEPSTRKEWEKSLYEIAKEAKCKVQQGDWRVNEYAIELTRDYARRSICAMLNLYHHANRTPSDALTKDLHRIHLDLKLKADIQTKARCYSLFNRPSFLDEKSSA